MMSVYDTGAVDASDKAIPVLRGLPGLGVALQLHNNALKFFAETVRQYGDRVELRVLGRRVLLLTNPVDIEAVLKSNATDFGRSTEIKNLRSIFGDGIYSSEGDRWRNRRRAVQPAFHRSRILEYSSTVIERMTERADKWRHGQKLHVFKEMAAFTTDVICQMILGQENGPDAQAIANSVSIIFESVRAEILYVSLWRKLPFWRSRRWNQAVKALDAGINNIIARRRSNVPESDDFLGLLLAAKDQNGNELSDKHVRDEAITMFLAGQETSAVALSWAIALLAQNPGFQEEVASEVAEVTNGRQVTPEDYPRLKFTNAVVQETLRLYPPLWNIARYTKHDTMVGDMAVRAGTEVWIPIHQIHRDARWFREPNRFNPYRWNDEVQRPKFSFFPFGGGPHNCVAQHFAIAELVLGLVTILSRFRFRLVPDAAMEMDAWLTLRPKNSLQVVVVRNPSAK
jgi:cytochrome P450